MQDAVKRSWWSRNWKWVVPVGCLTPIVICGGGATLIVALVFGVIKESGAYQDSLAQAQTDARVVAALGTPIEPGFFVMGNIEVNGPAGTADLSYSISGPNGTATSGSSSRFSR